MSSSSYQSNTRTYEYTSAADISLLPIPVMVHDRSLHEKGDTRVIPFDLSKQLGTQYPCTSPNLMASFMRISPSTYLETCANATSQAFYVIRGSGMTESDSLEIIRWNEGDLFVIPAHKEKVTHHATEDSAIYWITDEPLLQYLGVHAVDKKFKPAHFTKAHMLQEVEILREQPNAEHRNRMGVLLGIQETETTTKTLTHTLWSLLNVLPKQKCQKPHRHNSVALDLCVSASDVGIYTLMGPELDDDGNVKNPIRCDWKTGSVFVTPPGWWHSHHNESDKDAWVLPMQDAGLYTHQRTLDIQFVS
jgi:gentisate 1,2-dioxygenase